MDRNPHAGTPFEDDDETIAAMLEQVSIPALMCSLVHMTGDPSWVRGEIQPRVANLVDVQSGIPPDEQAEVRRRALPAVAAYRDAGCQPKELSGDVIAEMMAFLGRKPVEGDLAELFLDDLQLEGGDSNAVTWGDEIPDDVKARADVVVIGCGMAGILAGIRLTQAGLPFTIVDKNDGPGGTWWENRYPGARVDTGSHQYCYSFEPSDHWSEFFSRQPELQAYVEDTARRHDVLSHVRFDTEVTAARWDDDAGTWTVEVTGPSGHDTMTARAVISAVGQLNRPKLPDIEGLGDFAGPTLHTAAWDPGVELAGRRVGVIGTGASAFQLVPAIAGEVGHLSVFQRSAPWMFENPNYHEAVGDGVRWALAHLPYYGRWYRFLLFWPACDGGMPAMRIDPDYPHQDRACSEINDAARELFTGWITSQCGDDDELAAKVVPDYVCLGTRTLQDNGSWIAALRRDDVDLVTDTIVRIEADAVVTRSAEGTEARHELDVLVLATGFHANRYLWPMRIEGRGGAVLSEQWGDEPTALYGITVPNFPNLFCLYGPGTNLASGGSLIFHSECEMRYVMGCLRMVMSTPGAHSIEVTAAAHDDYNERLQEELSHMVWSHPSIRHSWYRNADGRIYILSPWRLVDFWEWTKEPDPADYTIR
jgi:4-hydroxyacetophenone monooxygenase